MAKALKNLILFGFLLVVLYGMTFHGRLLRDLFLHTKNNIGLKERLKVFDSEGSKKKRWRNTKPVQVFWTKEAVPYIKAQTDEDLFYVTGVLQAHLRGAQLEVFRRLSQGRLAEVVGVKALDLDVFLRTIDVGKAHKEIYAKWSDEAKLAMESFKNGLNDYFSQQEHLPLDLKLMGIKQVPPWTIKDLICVHRLMGADANWRFWPKLIKAFNSMGRDRYSVFWKNWIQTTFEKTDSDFAGAGAALDRLSQVTEAGSNAYAVSSQKSATGKPLVAGDPHLGLTMPNYWLLMGQESPTYKHIGVFMPSFPVAAMGRTRHLAFTGTNMIGVNSFLYKLSPEELLKSSKRAESFKVRFSEDLKLEVLDSLKGPVVTNTDVLKSETPMALSWSGHRPSNELDSFMKALKAKSVHEFKKAFYDFGVVALNYVVADHKGNINKIHVTQLPILKNHKKELIQFEDNPILKYQNVKDFPEDLNPLRGFVASANDLNKKAKPAFCWFCSTNDRVERISEVLSSKEKVSLQDIKVLQSDVYSFEASFILKEVFEVLKEINFKAPEPIENLKAWSFKYDVDLVEPYYYEQFVYEIVEQVYTIQGFSEEQKRALFSYIAWKKRALETLKTFSKDAQVLLFSKVFEKIRRLESKTWGEVHRLKVAFPMASLPFVGKSFVLYEGPYPGSSNTVFKAAHAYNRGDQYNTNFGANLKLIFDLSKEDENYFVLLGGQDGHIRSKNSGDQIESWVKSKYYEFPFSLEGIQKQTVEVTNF